MDTMNNKSILIVIGSLVGIFAFLYVVFKLTNVTADYSKLMTVTEEDHAKWSPDKKHVLVEYSDFQCPACKNFNDLFNTFEASGSPNGIITKKVTLVFRHYPLYQIHENAFETAYAVEAASAQGKFFEMADAVFKDQAQLTDNPQTDKFLEAKAREAGLDVAKFNRDRKSEAVKAKVEADLKQGQQAGINATPTFFLDGRKMEIASIDQFVQTLKNLE
jgi:protein-disulfide isomerase